MTNKEAFRSVIQIASVDDNTLDLGLIEAGIDASATFEAGKLKDLEIAAVPVLQSLMAITSNSEGGFSQSMNKDAINARLLFIAKKNGLTDLLSQVSDVPVIKDISWLW